MKIFQPKNLQYLFIAAFAFFFMESCKPKGTQSAATGDASKAYVAPGKYDEFYNFVSGGFSGQMAVYGLLFFPPIQKKDGVTVKKQNQC